MATAAANEDLQCALCLNEYTNPKFLPCHHTYCQKCIENLVQNTQYFSQRCPTCRKYFSLPPGGASALQTNFYIASRSNHGLCKTHPAKPLELFCSQCDVAICTKCMFSVHSGHNVNDLDEVVDTARKNLLGYKANFKKEFQDLVSELVQVNETTKNFAVTREKLTQQINEREAVLRKNFNDVLADCKQELLTEFDTSVHQAAIPLLDSKRQIENSLSTVREQTHKVETAPNDNNSSCLLAVT